MHKLRTASCSTRVVMICRLFGLASRNPPIAQLSDSEPHEVKAISSGARAPINSATCDRARSTAARMVLPKRCADDGLPYCVVKYGCMVPKLSGASWWGQCYLGKSSTQEGRIDF